MLLIHKSRNFSTMCDDCISNCCGLQMVRRVKAYLSRMPIVENEDELMQMSLRWEIKYIESSISVRPIKKDANIGQND